MQKAEAAVDAALEIIAAENRRAISTWNHPVKFNKAIVTAADSVDGTLKCPDLIWQWVNLGTVPTSIFEQRSSLSGRGLHVMAFPFQGRGQSYSAKTDGGSGNRLGPVTYTGNVNDRSIRPRHMAEKSLAAVARQVITTMEAILNG